MFEIGVGCLALAVLARLAFRLRLAHIHATRGAEAARHFRLRTPEGRVMRWAPFCLILASMVLLLLAGR